jgi:hypothetical protein
MKRRDFLKNAGAAIVPAALPAALWSSPSLALENASARDKGHLVVREFRPITAVLYDERYADCRAFAETLARHGAKAFATNQDAVALWYGPLRAYLEKNPGRIAGLATYADFSSSIACGRELAYTIRFEGHHDGRDRNAPLTHRLRTPAGAGEIASAISDEDWATQLAEALTSFPVPDRTSETDEPRWNVAKSPIFFEHPGYLNSWLVESVS